MLHSNNKIKILIYYMQSCGHKQQELQQNKTDTVGYTGIVYYHTAMYHFVAILEGKCAFCFSSRCRHFQLSLVRSSEGVTFISQISAQVTVGL